MDWLLLGSIVVLCIYGVPLAILVRALRRATLQIGDRRPVSRDEVPDAIRAVLDAEAERLAARGFERLAYERVDPLVRAEGVATWGATLWCDAWRSFAMLNTTPLVEANRPLQVSFVSLLRDGGRLLTMNGDAWSVVGADPRTEEHDPYVHDLDAHCDAHFERLRPLPGTRHPVRATRERVVQAMRDDCSTRIAGMSQNGDLESAGEGAWRMTWRGALRWACIVRGRSRPYARWQAEARRRAKSEQPGRTTPALLADAFFHNRALESAKRGAGALGKAALLVGTLGLFALSFAGGFDALGMAVLVAVLLFHELGHWVGMRLFGYRETSIFFIPFFGAATSGVNAEATATQRMLVYLLGPVPGLLLGIALLLGRESGGAIGALWTAQPLLADRAVWMLLAINFLNLLPILPLDGGHIARLLLFGRHPWSEVAFRVLALLGLFGLGLLLGAPLLGVLAGVSALALPQALRTARLGRELAKLRRAGARPSERSLVESAFAWIERSGHARLPFPQQYAMVRDALLNDSAPSPGALATLGFGVLYLGCLVFGPAIALADQISSMLLYLE